MAYWHGMSNKDISARFLGFDSDADNARAMDEDRKLAYPSARTITSGLRAMELGVRSEELPASRVGRAADARSQRRVRRMVLGAAASRDEAPCSGTYSTTC